MSEFYLKYDDLVFEELDDVFPSFSKPMRIVRGKGDTDKATTQESAKKYQHHPDVTEDPENLDETHFDRDLEMLAEEQAILLDQAIDGDTPPAGARHLTNVSLSAFSWVLMEKIVRKQLGQPLWVNLTGDTSDSGNIGVYVIPSSEDYAEDHNLYIKFSPDCPNFFRDVCDVLSRIDVYELATGHAKSQIHTNNLKAQGIDAETAERYVRRGIMSHILIKNEYRQRTGREEYSPSPNLSDQKVYNRLASRGYKPFSSEELYGMAFASINPNPEPAPSPDDEFPL